MTEFNEPAWVGMDVDAELARYAEQDRRRALAEQAPPPEARRFPLRASLAGALVRLAKGGSLPRPPLVA